MSACVRRLMPLVRRRVERAVARGWVQVHLGAREDLVQEILAALIARTRNLNGVRTAAGEAERFVTVAADRTLISLGRRDRAEKRDVRRLERLSAADLPDPDLDPEQRTLVREHARWILDQIHQDLPPRGRAVLWLWLFDDLDPGQIARKLGVEVQVVYNWQHRIRRAGRRLRDA